MKRIEGLDSLRGLAALGVALYHYTDVYSLHTHPLSFLFVWMRYGVNLFFMISGFVIYLTLQKVRRPLDFFVSRFSRLFPAYWVAVTLTFIVTHLASQTRLQIDLGSAIINLSMLQGFLNVPLVDYSYWTLQTELSFYFVILVILYFGGASKVNGVFIFLLGLEISERVVGKIFPNLVFHLDVLPNDLFFHYVQYFSIGIALYQLGALKEFHRTSNYVILALSFLLTKQDLPWLSAGLHLLFSMVIFLVAFGFSGPLTWKPLVYLGILSYPFYLIHQYIGYVILDGFKKFNVDPNLSIFLVITICLAVAAAINRWVERPARKSILAGYHAAFSKGASGKAI